MQTTIPTSKPSLWQALRDLDFLSAFFSWFFMLLTRLSEPLMLLATLYVVAETGVPAIATIALHNLAIGIMITAPEIILPGAFVVASRSQEHARTLFGICWAFVILTGVTLISLFVWHLTGQALAWLMCARCAAAVGYSILMRVMNHAHNRLQVVSVPTVTERLSEIEANMKRVMAEQITRTEANITERFVEHLQQIEATTEHRIVETEQRITERLQQTTNEIVAQFADRTSTEHSLVNERMTGLTEMLQAHDQALTSLFTLHEGLGCQWQELLQEVKGALESASTRPKLTLVESSPNTKVKVESAGVDKAAFVRQCFTEHPEMRNADIQRKASEQGITISPAYISELRKLFTEEQTA